MGQEIARTAFSEADHRACATRLAEETAMLMHDERVIRQDCLCHLMERLSYPG